MAEALAVPPTPSHLINVNAAELISSGSGSYGKHQLSPSSCAADVLRWESSVVSLDDDAAAVVIAKELLEVWKGGFSIPDVNAFGEAFRIYTNESTRRASVESFYRLNHINQTYDFVLRMKEKHLKLDKAVMSVWDAALLLNEYVDESDPDLDEPQIEHLLQTAEAIRKDYPNDDWFHLIGFIHDLGKVLLHPKFGAEPQWAVVGDAFPVGCRFDTSIVHHEFFLENPDSRDARFTSENGVYEPGCGLDNVHISWGHDEYMYQVMVKNGCSIPPQGLYMVRYHSFYAFHREEKYQHLMNEFDREMLPWLKRFNRYDLYSKSKVLCDVDELKPYYLSLIEKYFGKDDLRW